ncbi:helix-loop-helix DNA-binding domain-containing protein [Halteromyces radiatus]|uniref:helix-loop-helix DNA-binding domain-containing protein n=1 Tax=Halteromyces radiatus TaxID=101107 RepID=UPI00221F3E3B|nr:helix-loop-helix DNA-binding domain-containing protein [Halteromyces radiatus]KAI8084822.1 helix-loop-helix DNA-binding domain-containing protein [Halteromyces radiatus]
MNSSNTKSDYYSTTKGGLRLTNPTAYHLQQQRLKYKDIDPTLDHSQLFLSQQHQQKPNERSPHLSDIGYSELTSPVSLHHHADYMNYSSTMQQGTRMISSLQQIQHHNQDRHSMNQNYYMYGDQSIDSSFSFNTTMTQQMKRTESNDGDHLSDHASTVSPQGFMFYPLDQPCKQVSAPVNITYSDTTAHKDIRPSSSFTDAEYVQQDAELMMMNSSSPSNSSGNFGYPGKELSESRSLENYDDDYAAQVNLQIIMEKRRRRRESHNAVERRRRDNINERIQELGTLLLDVPDDGVNRLNKGTILKKSVEQIKQLQQDFTFYRQRVQELESILQQINTNQQN